MSEKLKMTPVSLLAMTILLVLQMETAHAQLTSANPAPLNPDQQKQGEESPGQARDDVGTLDTVQVTGSRATQRSSITVKRDASVIVDALVNDEIGALPDNSVAETLERVTGVTADRFKGSASEISIRGMGPYLGFSTLNGREVSSGSGDRAVSFQQFPSELTNGVLVYKSQQADFVEGGISGVIELRTARPLDYKKRRLQAEGRANYLPYADKAGEGLGSRFSGSYVDQFKTGLGEVGVALGLATTDSSAPEDFYTAASSYRPCNSINLNPTAVSGAGTGNCNYSADASNPVYFVPNQFSFRQLNTRDKRRAFTGSVQWKPNEQWDIALDTQLSRRSSYEDRHDLVFAEGRRGISPMDVGSNGALLSYAGNGYLESQATERERDENYAGGGLSAKFDASEALTLQGDISYSRTHRDQVDFATRLRSNTLFGPGGRVAYAVDQASSDIPRVDFVNPIDLNNHDAYTGNAYARRRAEDRLDEISAARFDMTYSRYGAWNQIKTGLRVSSHDRVTDLGNDNNLEPISSANTLAGNQDCRVGNAVQSWGEDSETNVSSWAQFDTRCLYRAFTGSHDLGPLEDKRSVDDLDINERIGAAYVMGSFSTELASIPFSGNLGVRWVDTQVSSRGYRGAYTLQSSPDPITGVVSYNLLPVAGTFEPITIESSYRSILPSFNGTLTLRDNLYLRGALYKAIARSNIEDLGAGRVLITDSQAATPEEALAGASGGNPRLKPLQSWNVDLSLEYYQDDDTSYSLALFYKQLQSGVEPVRLQETFVIDGIPYTVPVAQIANSNKQSYLRGFEVGVNKGFSSLPAPFDGLGLQASYSYADSNFEYVDPSAVDSDNPLLNFVDPAGIPGLSKHSGSVGAYYEQDEFSLRLAYKYRSDYFKPSPLTANRNVDDAGFLDFSATYNINRNIQLKLQAINITNEHQVMYRPVEGSIAESSYFGTSYFVGIRFRY